MIGKIVQGKGFKGVVNYVLDKDKAQLVETKDVRLKDKNSIIASFVAQSRLKPNIAKPVAHISLDFSKQDKERLTDSFMVNIATEYMEKMGYKDTQFIICRHHDTEHPHIHLVINRINNHGERITDKNEKFRNVKVCKELTRRYGLYFAKGKEQVKEHRLKEPDKTKYEIYNSIKKALPDSRSWNQLLKELEKQNIYTSFKRKGQTNEIQGVTFTKNDYTFSGSKVDRMFSYSKICKELSLNVNRQEAKQSPVQSNDKSTSYQNSESLLGSLLPTSSYDQGEEEFKRNLLKKKKKRGFGL